MNNNYLYEKSIECIGNYDVVVVGGGPSGISAAVCAAECGASVCLIERLGVLGGNLTVGNISPILGEVAPGTMCDRIISLFAEGHPDLPQARGRIGREIKVDHEEAKIRLTALVAKSGVKFMLLTSVADVIKEGNTVKGLVLCTPSGLRTLYADVIIDATGDGQVAYLAGAEYKIGRESDGGLQPATIEFVVENVDESVAITAWGGSDPVKLPDGREYRLVCKEKNAAGELPEFVTIVRLHRTYYSGERSVNASQINGTDTLDGEGLAGAEMELRSQTESIIAFLRKNIPGFENCRMKNSASVVGVRETRRIIGDYVLCDEDVERGLKKDDVVVHNAWFLIDIHNPSGGGQAEGYSRPALPYDIPYRCLLVKDIENLITCGRCISGTHRAHASYRVMAICMATGEAAGVAAAVAVADKTTPRGVDVKKIQELLMKRGVTLYD